MISFICCSIKQSEAEALRRNIEESVGVPFEFIVFDNTKTGYGLCKVYNQCAEKAKYDYLCFVHEYGAPIFHTSNREVWDFVNRFVEINNYINTPIANYKGNTVINYTERDIPYTRIIEHKHFEFCTQPKSVITREYPAEYNRDNIPYYPIADQRNNDLYLKYNKLADGDSKVLFGGRLGEYSYYDMDQIIDKSLKLNINE